MKIRKGESTHLKYNVFSLLILNNIKLYINSNIHNKMSKANSEKHEDKIIEKGYA